MNVRFVTPRREPHACEPMLGERKRRPLNTKPAQPRSRPDHDHQKADGTGSAPPAADCRAPGPSRGKVGLLLELLAEARAARDATAPATTVSGDDSKTLCTC